MLDIHLKLINNNFLHFFYNLIHKISMLAKKEEKLFELIIIMYAGKIDYTPQNTNQNHIFYDLKQLRKIFRKHILTK